MLLIRSSAFAAFVYATAAVSTVCASKTSLSLLGSASTSIPADCAHIIVTVNSQSENALTAQNTTASSLTQLFGVLTHLNATKVNTDGMSLSGVYNYSNTPSTLIGFNAQAVISFETKLGEAGRAIDSAIQNGADNLQSISFTAQDDNYAKALKSVKASAVQNAIDQAGLIATQLKLCVKAITSIVVDPQSNNYSPPVYAAFAETAKAGGQAVVTTPVQASGIQVSSTAQVNVELDKC
ncbi:hypothetical protein BDR26DRAFT_921289 [Obelidium mucronatum]|nr:hypothetical protein BDR26DRAFT_921289 [Obelidium mucronatum]